MTNRWNRPSPSPPSGGEGWGEEVYLPNALTPEEQKIRLALGGKGIMLRSSMKIHQFLLALSVLLCLAAFVPYGLIAEGLGAEPASLPALPSYLCHRIDRELALSGKVDDPLWQKAEVMQLRNPADGRPARYRTTARMLYNDQYLYIAFQCEDEYVWGTHTERDAPIYEEECVEAFLCPSGKVRQYYEINVSPRNTVFDAFIINGRPEGGARSNFRTWKDYTCDGLVTKVHINGKLGVSGARGWMAEFAIPFDSIIGADRLRPQAGDEWRMNLFRIDTPKSKNMEFYSWSPTGANDYHRPWRFGWLRFE